MTYVFVKCGLSPYYNRAKNKAKGEEAKVDLELWDQNQVIDPYISQATELLSLDSNVIALCQD
jgi:hypothetical protein